MKRANVESSKITSIGYDVKACVLEVEFRADGSVYRYQNVPKSLYDDLMGADSIGVYFGRWIQKFPDKYPYAKLVSGDAGVVGAVGGAKWSEEKKSEEKKSAVVPPAVVPPAPEEITVTVTVITAKVNPLPEKARKLTIRDNKEYALAAEFLLGIKDLRAEVDAAFDPIVAKAHEAHKTALAQKKKAEAPLIEAEDVVKRTIAGYLRSEEDKRRAEEERIRQEHEAKIRAQAEEENLRRAQTLAEQGDLDGAAEAVDAEVEVPEIPVHVESSVPKIGGISKRVRYVVARVELLKLVCAVAEGRAPLETLRANDSFLGAQATAYKKAGELFPGVHVKSEDNIAAGR